MLLQKIVFLLDCPPTVEYRTLTDDPLDKYHDITKHTAKYHINPSLTAIYEQRRIQMLYIINILNTILSWGGLISTTPPSGPRSFLSFSYTLSQGSHRQTDRQIADYRLYIRSLFHDSLILRRSYGSLIDLSSAHLMDFVQNTSRQYLYGISVSS